MKDTYSIYKDKLKGEYQETFEKIDIYCNYLMKNYNDEKREEIMAEILDTFLNAQNDKKQITKITGNNIEKYCKNACKVESKKMIIIKILTFFKNMAEYMLILTIFYKMCGIESNIITIIASFFLILLANNIDKIRIKQSINNKRKSKKSSFEWITFKWLFSMILIVTIGTVIVSIFGKNIGGKAISTVLIQEICLIYIALYYLIIRDNTPKYKNISVKENVKKELPNVYKKKFEKKYNKSLKSGKNAITESEFIEREIKRCKSSIIFCEKISWILPILFTIGFVFGVIIDFREQTKLENILIVTTVFSIILLSYFPYKKFMISTFKLNLEFLNKCKKENIKWEDWNKVILN